MKPLKLTMRKQALRIIDRVTRTPRAGRRTYRRTQALLPLVFAILDTAERVRGRPRR
jgi:hypothetical protein